MNQPEPYRYIDADDFCLSARLLPDLDNGGFTETLSITIEGSDEPQSVHIPRNQVENLIAGLRRAAAVSSAGQAPATHGLSVQHADALWDAIATPGPHTATYPEQHERVCRAVRDILDELTPAPDEPTDQAATLREQAERLSTKANKLTENLHNLAYFVAKDRLREAEILDREATELRRLADETPDTQTQADEPVVTVHAAPDLSPAASEALGALVGVAKAQAVCDEHPCGRRTAAGARQDETAPEAPHTCKPGASTYYCPTSGETESDCHGGFTTCCDRPDLHQPAAGARQDGDQT